MRFKAGRRLEVAPPVQRAVVPSTGEPSRVRRFLSTPVPCGTCAKVRRAALTALQRATGRK